jgi:alcohol dehydrogenase
VTDAGLAATPVIAAATDVLDAAGVMVSVFSGVHPNPTTAGTGAETSAFGVVTDTATRRKFYVGHASSLPAAAILDPELTIGLPSAATAGGWFDIPHGVALTMLLPQVLRFNLPACEERFEDIAVALGVADSGRPASWNLGAVIDCMTSLRDQLGMAHTMAGLGITAEDFDQIAADALDDEVLANTPRRPSAADIRGILLAQP